MAKKKGMKLIANNKKAFHDYFIEDTYEAGIALAGTEVKSLRMGKCSIKESFIRVENGEVYIYGMHISPYEKGNIFNKDPLRIRKLLLHRYEINKIEAKLKEKGLDENTIVIFSSDNGPHEEGGADPEFFGRDGTLRGLKRQCYEGGIRIPFIVRWPGKVKAGTVNDHQLAFYDIMPTFCELIGDKKFPKKYINKNLEGDCFDGISFAPTLFGDDENQKKHDYLYWEFHETDQLAVRMGDWKLVVKKGIPHLYNLADDIHEDNDISTNHPEIVKQMIEIIKKEQKESDFFKVTLPL